MNERIERIITSMEANRARFWSVPKSTALFLAELARFVEARLVLEVGTSQGYSGIFLASALQERAGTLITVESHAERFALARGHFMQAGLENVQQVKGHAPEVIGERFGAEIQFDMIFLDATKLEYPSYIDATLPLLRSGGVMVADNCLSHAQELNPFVRRLNELEQAGLLQQFLLQLDNGLMFIWKS